MFFILLLVYSFADASLILTENSSGDVTTTSGYVITISCTDGTETTFFDLTLIFTTKDPAVTEKPNTQSDITPIIIGAFIGGLFIIVVIIVVCVRKRQHKNNDENMANEKALELSNIDCSSEGATLNQYSRVEELDAIPHDNSGYLDMRMCRNDAKQPSSSEGCIYQTYLLTLPPFRGSLPRKSLISRMEWVSCAGDIKLPHRPFPPARPAPNKKIKYNKILTYILRSIFLEIPHLELPR